MSLKIVTFYAECFLNIIIYTQTDQLFHSYLNICKVNQGTFCMLLWNWITSRFFSKQDGNNYWLKHSLIEVEFKGVVCAWEPRFFRSMINRSRPYFSSLFFSLKPSKNRKPILEICPEILVISRQKSDFRDKTLLRTWLWWSSLSWI